MKKHIEKIEDIYPLVIVSMRFGGKFVILNLEVDSAHSLIADIESEEEVSYIINDWLEENISPHYYGIGDTIQNAFKDYQIRYLNS